MVGVKHAVFAFACTSKPEVGSNLIVVLLVIEMLADGTKRRRRLVSVEYVKNLSVSKLARPVAIGHFTSALLTFACRCLQSSLEGAVLFGGFVMSDFGN